METIISPSTKAPAAHSAELPPLFYGRALPLEHEVVYVAVSANNKLKEDNTNEDSNHHTESQAHTQHNAAEPHVYIDDNVPFLVLDLLEFGKAEGMVVSTEFSSKKNKKYKPFRGLYVGKRFALLVSKVDHKKGFVDLSKLVLEKREKAQQQQQQHSSGNTDQSALAEKHICQVAYDKAGKLVRIAQNCAQKCDMPVDEVLRQFVWPFYQHEPTNHSAAHDAIIDFLRQQHQPTPPTESQKQKQQQADQQAKKFCALLVEKHNAPAEVSSAFAVAKSFLELAFSEMKQEVGVVDAGDDTGDLHVYGPPDLLSQEVECLVRYAALPHLGLSQQDVDHSILVQLRNCRATHNVDNSDILQALLTAIFYAEKHNTLSACTCTATQTTTDTPCTASFHHTTSTSPEERRKALQKSLFKQLIHWAPTLRSFMDTDTVHYDIRLVGHKDCDRVANVPRGQMELLFWIGEFCTLDLNTREANHPDCAQSGGRKKRRTPGVAEFGFGTHDLVNELVWGVYSERVDLVDENAVLAWIMECSNSDCPHNKKLAELCDDLAKCILED